MKHIYSVLVLGLLALSLVACKNQDNPKSLSEDFITSVHTLDFEEASSIATDQTAAVLKQNKSELEQRNEWTSEKSKRKEDDVAALFHPETLVVKQIGNEAEVSNDLVTVHLKLVDGEWKVAEDANGVSSILFKSRNQEEVKTAWKKLQGEYENRMKLLSEFVAYRKSYDGASQALKAIETASSAARFEGEPTAGKVADYIKKQDQLDGLLDKGLTPSFTAGSDLSLNYIIGLDNAEARVKEARLQYNQAAQKANNKNFPVLPSMK